MVQRSAEEKLLNWKKNRFILRGQKKLVRKSREDQINKQAIFGLSGTEARWSKPIKESRGVPEAL